MKKMFKKMMKLVHYQVQLYLKGSSFVVPLVVTLFFLCGLYSMKPLEVVESFLTTGNFFFFLMVWIGWSVMNSENPVAEQIVYLRMQNPLCYYGGKVLTLLALVLCGALLCAGFPVLANILNGGTLFEKSLTLSAVANGFLLLLGIGFTGAVLGSFWQPSLMKNRKMALMLTMLLAILSFVGPAMGSAMGSAMLQSILTSFVRLIFCVLPPVLRPTEVYGMAADFSMGKTLTVAGTLFLYGIVYSFLKAILCYRKKL